MKALRHINKIFGIVFDFGKTTKTTEQYKDKELSIKELKIYERAFPIFLKLFIVLIGITFLLFFSDLRENIIEKNMMEIVLVALIVIILVSIASVQISKVINLKRPIIIINKTGILLRNKREFKWKNIDNTLIDTVSEDGRRYDILVIETRDNRFKYKIDNLSIDRLTLEDLIEKLKKSNAYY